MYSKITDTHTHRTVRLLAVIANVISTHDDTYFYRGVSARDYERTLVCETKAKTVQTVIRPVEQVNK